jgi:uncharacterized membrane protein YkvA (DUF1232 family)|nr:YkvA family protein [Neorhizobium tomejilense]
MDNKTSTSSGVSGRLASAFSFLPRAKTVARAMKRATSRVPFMDDVLAMYYCAVDPATPRKIRVVIGATLLYLVMPLDIVPDLLAIVGYTDDVTALMVLVRLVSSHVTDKHREKAKASLEALRDDPKPATDAA